MAPTFDDVARAKYLLLTTFKATFCLVRGGIDNVHVALVIRAH